MTTQPAQATRAPRLGHYDIDARHSAVTFRTRHLFGLAPVRGAFTISSGTVDVAEPLAGSRIHAEIDAASFRTGNGQRDAAVRSAACWTPAGTRSSPSTPSTSTGPCWPASSPSGTSPGRSA